MHEGASRSAPTLCNDGVLKSKRHKPVMPHLMRHPFCMFKILCFKNPLQRCRTKGMGTGAGGTLFERPNVRVRAAAVNMSFVRAAAGRVAGRPFFGSFLWSEQRNEQRKNFKKSLFCTLLSRQRKCTPKSTAVKAGSLDSNAPCSLARAHVCSCKLGVWSSAILFIPLNYELNAPSYQGCKTMGFKTHTV
jgi:hypothetical protein